MRRGRDPRLALLWGPGVALVLGACGGEADVEPVSAEAVQACLEDEGLTVETLELAAEQLAGIEYLSVEDFSDGALLVAEDEAAAIRFFEEDGSVLGSGASELDWFRVGNVVVRFGERSTPLNHDIAETCAGG